MSTGEIDNDTKKPKELKILMRCKLDAYNVCSSNFCKNIFLSFSFTGKSETGNYLFPKSYQDPRQQAVD